MATCPVCSTDVDEDKIRQQTVTTAFGAKEVDPTAGTRRFHDGKWLYFDILECRSKFMSHPEEYPGS